MSVLRFKPLTRERIEDWAERAEIELSLYDGLDEAILGVGQRFNSYFVVYDYGQVIDILMRDGLSYEDAVEHFDFNIAGGWIGEGTPCFLSGNLEAS